MDEVICPACKRSKLLVKTGSLGQEFPACESCGYFDFAAATRLPKDERAVPLNRRAAAFQARRKTPPMTREECDALGEDLDPTGEVGLAAIDFDLETIRLLTDDLRAKHGRLPEKKLRKLQADVWERRSHERDRQLHSRDF